MELVSETLVEGIETARKVSEQRNVSAKRKAIRPLICSVGAILGIFGGASVLFAGLVCSIIHYVFAGDKVFDTVGTVFLIAAIPMMLIGSTFLDKTDHSSK